MFPVIAFFFLAVPGLSLKLAQDARNLDGVNTVSFGAQTVFDIGMNRGDDTAFYLKQGHKVIAVEANPVWAKRNAKLFAKEIESGRLTIINRALSDEHGKQVKFYSPKPKTKGLGWLNKFIPSKGSFNSGVQHEESGYITEVNHMDELASMSKYNACEEMGCFPWNPTCTCTEMRVETTTCEKLIEQYGVPTYLKIDIEGYDGVCMRSLAKLPCKLLPPFISFEEQGKQAHPQRVVSSSDVMAELGARGYVWKVTRQLWKDHGSVGTGLYGDEAEDYTYGKVWRSAAEASEQANDVCWEFPDMGFPKYDCDVQGKLQSCSD